MCVFVQVLLIMGSFFKIWWIETKFGNKMFGNLSINHESGYSCTHWGWHLITLCALADLSFAWRCCWHYTMAFTPFPQTFLTGQDWQHASNHSRCHSIIRSWYPLGVASRLRRHVCSPRVLQGEGGVRGLWQAASHTADSSVKDSCLGRARWSSSPPACASQPLRGGERSRADWSDGGSVELIGATRTSGWKIQAECKNTKCCQCYYHLH